MFFLSFVFILLTLLLPTELGSVSKEDGETGIMFLGLISLL